MTNPEPAFEEWKAKALAEFEEGAKYTNRDRILKQYFAHQLDIAHSLGRKESAAAAFEILHKYAMQTKDTATLDFIESVQREILASATSLTEGTEI